MSPEQPIDWTALATTLGTITEHGEIGGTSEARAALELILGEERILEAVDAYLSHRPGSELARSVLSFLRSPIAMHECYRRYQTSEDLERRRDAVELLRAVADSTTLPWIAEFLDDPDEGVHVWAAGVLDYLVLRDLVEGHEEQVESLLERLMHHPVFFLGVDATPALRSE